MTDTMQTKQGERLSAQQARKWVKEYWQDTLRSSPVPDLPEQWHDAIFAVFEDESQRIANRIGPTYRKVRRASLKEAQS